MSRSLDAYNDSILSFILSREKTEGGFSFSKTTPATREDTYFAIKTLQTLGIDYSYTPTIEYVKSLSLNDEMNLRSLFQTIYLNDYFGITIEPERLLEVFNIRINFLQNDITSLFYYNKIQRLLKLKCDVKILDKVLQNNLSILKYIREIYRQIQLMIEYQIPFNRSLYCKWILQDQNLDGGFGFLHNTTSFLENTFFALNALNSLQAVPQNLTSCEAFVERCQSSTGGYGRQSGTLANLISTYQAVKSLMIIQEMKSQLKK